MYFPGCKLLIFKILESKCILQFNLNVKILTCLLNDTRTKETDQRDRVYVNNDDRTRVLCMSSACVHILLQRSKVLTTFVLASIMEVET